MSGKVEVTLTEHLQVPSPGDLELDAWEPGVDRLPDVAEQHLDRVLDAEVGSGDHVPRGAAEQPVQRRGW